jgi:putative aldouronate transport system substrate-binding protein
MKRKLLSIILGCTMTVSLLGGCKSNKPVSTEGVSATPAAETGNNTADDKPEYSEISVEVFDRGTDGGKTDPADNYYTDWIKKKVLNDENIGVNFVKVSRWEENTQLNNLMAAGSAPDVCITYSNDLVTTYRDQGGLADLAPYIDTLLADLDGFLGEDKALEGRRLIERNKIMDTGEIFYIPARRINLAAGNTFIRKDWLDKLNLALPTTTEEFYDALVAFKKKDPGNVGKKNVIPFIMTRDVRWRAGTLIESFIDPDISDKDYWINTVVDRHYLLPGYKDGMRYLNKMYNEDLIDKQFALYKDDTDNNNLIKSGVVGSFIHNWDQAYRDSEALLTDLKKNVPDAEFVTIDPFKDKNGKTTKSVYDQAGANFFIPASSKNIEGALRYINWLSKFENRYYLQIGDEGVTHEMVDGLPKMKATDGEKIMNSSNNIDYTIMINGLDVGDDSKLAQAIAQSYSVDSQYTINAYDMAMKDCRQPIIIPVTLSAAGPVSQTLIDKGEEFLAQAVSCKPDKFDKIWDDGIKEWLSVGAQDVIDERAEKYIEP